MSKDSHRYDDMLELPHHRSTSHPPMPLYNRAAQFSPFAALTGYGDAVEETARLTIQKPILSENEKELLDTKFQLLIASLDMHTIWSFTYFVPDSFKEGGAMKTVSGAVKKIDLNRRLIILYAENDISDGICVSIDDVTALEPLVEKS